MHIRLLAFLITLRRSVPPASLMPMLVGAGVFLAGCSHDHTSVVGLLDQIQELTPPGSWRVVADIPHVGDELVYGSRLSASGLHSNEKGFVGQGGAVELAVNIAVAAGEILLCTLEPAGRGDPDQAMVVALHGKGDSTRIEVRLRDKQTPFWLAVPQGGAAKLAIWFPLAPNRVVPIEGIRIISIPRDSNERERGRALALNSIAKRSEWGAPDGLLVFRRFPLQLEGVTRDCVALVGPDTLSLGLPERLKGATLQFWSVVLRGDPRFRVEIRNEGQWQGGQYPSTGGATGRSWRSHVLDWPLQDGCDSMRVISEGRFSDVVAIGEPTLRILSRTSAGKYNVIVIDLDTMRADRLGSYGYTTRPTSDRFDSIADAKGFFVFRNAYSAGPHTLPATAKFMTSRYLDIHEAHSVPRHYTTLAEVLRDHGYYCAAFTSGGTMRSPGFEQGFHEYHSPRGDVKVEEVFPLVHRWLEDAPPAPFFLFVHTYESHGPYTRDTFCRGLPRGRLGDLSKGERLFPRGKEILEGLSPMESTYVQAAYDGGVAKACDATADLFRLLDDLRLWPRTVVIVLSDHGEEFWEHSDRYATHEASSVHGELLNVPFLLFSPRHTGGEREYINTPVSTVDLLPTLCDLIGIPIPVRCDGVSILPLVEGKLVSRDVPILATNDPRRSATRRACMISGTTKYIEPFGDGLTGGMRKEDPYSDEPALYFLAEDPGEKRNQLDGAPDIAGMMADSLRAALSRAEKPIELDSPAGRFSPTGELREQLRVLGYVVDQDTVPGSGAEKR